MPLLIRYILFAVIVIAIVAIPLYLAICRWEREQEDMCDLRERDDLAS